MDTDSDNLLNQLVVAAMTLFITLIMLLAALVLRQVWLQQRIVELSSDLQVNLMDLQETTEEIQNQLSEMHTAADTPRDAESLEEIANVLNEVDEQLEFIGEDIGEVVLVLEPQEDAAPSSAVENEQARANQDQVDQVFAVFAALVGAVSIAIAILWGMAVRIQALHPTHTTVRSQTRF